MNKNEHVSAIDTPSTTWLLVLMLALGMTIAVATLALLPVFAGVELVTQGWVYAFLGIGLAWLGSWQLLFMVD